MLQRLRTFFAGWDESPTLWYVGRLLQGRPLAEYPALVPEQGSAAKIILDAFSESDPARPVADCDGDSGIPTLFVYNTGEDLDCTLWRNLLVITKTKFREEIEDEPLRSPSGRLPYILIPPPRPKSEPAKEPMCAQRIASLRGLLDHIRRHGSVKLLEENAEGRIHLLPLLHNIVVPSHHLALCQRPCVAVHMGFHTNSRLGGWFGPILARLEMLRKFSEAQQALAYKDKYPRLYSALKSIIHTYTVDPPNPEEGYGYVDVLVQSISESMQNATLSCKCSLDDDDSLFDVMDFDSDSDSSNDIVNSVYRSVARPDQVIASGVHNSLHDPNCSPEKILRLFAMLTNDSAMSDFSKKFECTFNQAQAELKVTMEKGASERGKKEISVEK